ncbi:MAG: hypothetical protein KatS3mg076_2933 [Candidatus Binatia bacterium]|nr:MAG: hypothetical protein KatS3mg076_2933 [Candidatus Binatia bacterium]
MAVPRVERPQKQRRRNQGCVAQDELRRYLAHARELSRSAGGIPHPAGSPRAATPGGPRRLLGASGPCRPYATGPFARPGQEPALDRVRRALAACRPRSLRHTSAICAHGDSRPRALVHRLPPVVFGFSALRPSAFACRPWAPQGAGYSTAWRKGRGANLPSRLVAPSGPLCRRRLRGSQGPSLPSRRPRSSPIPPDATERVPPHRAAAFRPCVSEGPALSGPCSWAARAPPPPGRDGARPSVACPFVARPVLADTDATAPVPPHRAAAFRPCVSEGSALSGPLFLRGIGHDRTRDCRARPPFPRTRRSASLRAGLRRFVRAFRRDPLCRVPCSSVASATIGRAIAGLVPAPRTRRSASLRGAVSLRGTTRPCGYGRDGARPSGSLAAFQLPAAAEDLAASAARVRPCRSRVIS